MRKKEILVVLAMAFLLAMPLFGSANAESNNREMTVSLNLPVSDIINSTYLYNPDNVQISGNTSIPFSLIENNENNILGVQITEKDLQNYLLNNKLMPSNYEVSGIESYTVNMQINLTSYLINYINQTLTQQYTNQRINYGYLRFWYGYNGINDTKNANAWQDTDMMDFFDAYSIAPNEIQYGFIYRSHTYGVETTSGESQPITLGMAYQEFGFKPQNTYNPEYIVGNTTYTNSTSYSINLWIKEAIMNMQYNVRFDTATSGDLAVNTNVFIKTNGNIYSDVIPTAKTNIFTENNKIGVYFAYDTVNGNITVPSISKDIKVIANVDVQPMNAKANYNFILPLVAIGLIFTIFGGYRYDKEMLKGISLAFGLSLLITAGFMYAIPDWQYTWLLVLIPVTFTVLLTYLFVYTGFINSTLHPKLEYWILKWGDVLTLVLLVILMIEMWSGIFTTYIHPFWGVK